MKLMTKLMTKLTLILFASLALQACSNIVSAVHEGPLVEDEGSRTWGRAIDDGVIESKAIINLKNSHAAFKQGRIRAISHNGIVLLLGQVSDQAAIPLADNIVKDIRQVKSVENRITYAGKIGFAQRISDKMLAFQAKRAIIENSQVDAGRIEVICENGAIYLMGIVTRKEADIVTQAISNVPGITKITKVFEYLN